MTGRLLSLATTHSTGGARSLLDTNLPESGLLVTQAPPGLRRTTEMCAELLAALGKRDDVSGPGRDAELNWIQLLTWIAAYRITNLVILDAQWLARPILDDLAGLAALTGTDVWLVAQQPIEDAFPEALSRWPVANPPARQLATIVKAVPSSDGTHESPEFPQVPADSFLSFRAEARRQLTPDDFAILDTAYRCAFADAQAWFADLAARQVDADEDTLLAFLRPRLAQAPTSDEMVTIVRATQAASLRAGWLLNVETTQLFVTADQAAAAAVTSATTWRRLAAYREPYRGAVCALAAVGLGVDDMLDLSCSAVDPTGAQVTGAGGPIDIPAGAEVFLRAQLLWRSYFGADPADLFFADELNHPPVRRVLSQALRDPLVELGVPLISQQTVPARLDGARWLKRWGVNIVRAA